MRALRDRSIMEKRASKLIRGSARPPFGSRALEPTVDGLTVQTLEVRLGLRRQLCASLALEFEAAKTSDKKKEFARLWFEAMKEGDALELALERLKKKAGQDVGSAGASAARPL